MEIIWRVIIWERKGENGGKDTGTKKYNWQIQNRQGDVKNSIGNGEAKELTCMTHRHELREVGDCQREWAYWAEGCKGDKNWKTVIA